MHVTCVCASRRLSSRTSSRQRHLYSKDLLYSVAVATQAQAQARVRGGGCSSGGGGAGDSLTPGLGLLAVSCDGGRIACGGLDGRVHVVDTRTMAVAAVVQPGPDGSSLTALQFGGVHPWLLVTGHADGVARVLDAEQRFRAVAAVAVASTPLTLVRLAVDDSLLFAADASGGMALLRVAVTRPVGPGEGAAKVDLTRLGSGQYPDGAVVDAVIDPGCHTVAAVGSPRGVSLWSVKRPGGLTAALRWYKADSVRSGASGGARVRVVALDTSGMFVATADDDNV
jgi:hypothetical protein